MPNQDHVVLVAGGAGSRMRSELPKQFMHLCGKPILLHTMQRFMDFNPSIALVVVMHPDYVLYWQDLVRTLPVTIPHTVVAGGLERFHSVANGLQSIASNTGVVAIHDAVRPLVSSKTLEAAFATARSRACAIPVLPSADSIREMKDGKSFVVDRNNFRLVQTPQCFDLAELRMAFEQPYHHSFTDDAAVWEASGREVTLIEGNRENFKITTPEDLRLAEALMQMNR
jgi:2-C-methyl-D-erythritol 4-phosphate cytidylyltransferase